MFFFFAFKLVNHCLNIKCYTYQCYKYVYGCYTYLINYTLICIDSHLVIQVLNEKISLDQQTTLFPITLNRNISIENIQEIINIFDSVNICYGAVLASKYPHIKASFGYQYQYENGYWKHSECLKIISDNG